MHISIITTTTKAIATPGTVTMSAVPNYFATNQSTHDYHQLVSVNDKEFDLIVHSCYTAVMVEFGQ